MLACTADEALKAYDALTACSTYEAVVANEADVAVEALPVKLAINVELFSHLPEVELYTKGWPFVGPDILTSDKPANVCVTTEPPPPDPQLV